MFTTKRWRQGTNYLISMVQPIKTNFILVLRKLLLKNLILSISNLSMTDTMKKTQIYQRNFAVSKIATLPHQLIEKSNENTYLSTDKQTNAFYIHIKLLNKKTKLTTKYRHQNKCTLLRYDSKDCDWSSVWRGFSWRFAQCWLFSHPDWFNT